MRRLHLVLAAAALAMVSAPAAATGETVTDRAQLVATPQANYTGYLPSSASAKAQAADQAIAAIRSGLASTSYVAKVKALFGGDGLTLPTPTLPTPTDRQWADTQGLPSALRTPVAGLYAAVMAAEKRIGLMSPDTVRASSDAIADFLGSLPTRARDAPVLAQSQPQGGDGTPAKVRAFAGLMPPESALAPETVQAVEANPAAAMLVAEGLDTYLPAIRVAAQTLPSNAGETVAPCDLLDHSPYLCVGSDGNSSYATDEVLLIDLGGDDTYQNTAGGAPFLPPGGLNYVPLSVNVDLGGSDTYDTRTVSTLGNVSETVGEGGGWVGALGMLVDEGGNDTYVAVAPPPVENDGSGPLSLPVLAVQGTGEFGTGILFDLGGGDSYTADDRGHSTVVSSSVFAQGMGAAGNAGGCTLYTATSPPQLGSRPSCSLGALVDTGSGSDSYVIDATQEGTKPEFFRVAIGQGMGENVAGMLADDGGSDAFSISAQKGAPGSTGLGFGLSTIIPLGQGWGAGGAGLLLEGEGDTTYQVLADSPELAWNYEVGGQGFGLAEGTGVLDDLGGDDSYVTRASLPETYSASVGDGSGASQAKQLFIGVMGGPLNEVHAQGEGQNGLGLLGDHGGDDSYTLSARTTLDITLADHLSNPTGPATLQVVGFCCPVLWGQGFATGPAGAGILADDGGSDSYAARSLNAVHGAASSDHAKTDVTVVSQSQGFEGAQGASIGGTGALLDLGGRHDSFLGADDREASGSPGAKVFRWGGYWAPFQGMGKGVFVALGDAVSIATRPTNGVSPNSPNLHGVGSWLYDVPATVTGSPPGADPDHQVYDSAASEAVGYAPSSLPPHPTVAFQSSTGSSGCLSQAAPAAAKVVGADGQPLAGVPVRFDLQYGGPVTLPGLTDYSSWLNAWEATATTGSSGLAETTVPLNVGLKLSLFPSPTFYISDPALYEYRLLATVDATATNSGAHTLKPFTLSTTGPPAASLTASPTSGPAPLGVAFDASGSFACAPSDSISSYTFDFGDGTAPVTQSSPTVSHTYERGGMYKATLTVTDSNGTKSTNDASVTIQAQGATCFEDDDSHIAYDAGWHTVDDPDASAGHFRLSSGKGLSFSFSTGADRGSLKYFYATSTKGGSADLYVDGAKVQSVSYQGGGGSARAPVFGASATLPLSGSGFHIFELRNPSGTVYVDKLCVSEGSSSAQPAAGPGQTTTQTNALSVGQTLTDTLSVPANALSVSILAEANAAVPYKLVLLDPSGAALASADSKEGVASLQAPVSSGGSYLLKLVDLGLGPVSVWSAATPQVKK